MASPCARHRRTGKSWPERVGIVVAVAAAATAATPKTLNPEPESALKP